MQIYIIYRNSRLIFIYFLPLISQKKATPRKEWLLLKRLPPTAFIIIYSRLCKQPLGTINFLNKSVPDLMLHYSLPNEYWNVILKAKS